MKTLLTANLSKKKATSGGGAWEPPIHVFGESLTLALRLTQDVGGATIEPVLDVAALRAAIGSIDARPASGEWALQIGAGAQTADNTTAALPHECSPGDLAAAINAKPAVVAAYGTAAVLKMEGSWRIVFGAGAVQVPLTVVDNTLQPVSFGRISAYQVDAVWRHEVRLVQAPVAFTDASARVLPEPPGILLVRSGGSAGGTTWNEIQSLTVPPNFRGSYMLRSGGDARTSELTVDDGIAQIQAALAAVLGDNFTVTAGINFSATIEFINELAGAAQPLLVVEPLNPPPGDLTFTLPLDRAELAARLRTESPLTLPIEVRLWITDADEVVRQRVAFQQDIVIVRPLIWTELALIPSIDFLRPPSPRTYLPFNPETVITGQQFYPEVVGNGAATSFTIDHGLDTEIVHVWVRENQTNGLQLIEGTDFRVRIADADSVTVEALDGAPAADAWLVTVVSAQTVAAFAAGLEIEIAQVNGLEVRLAAMEAVLAAIQALIPSTPLGTTGAAGGAVFTIDIPAFADLVPGLRHGGVVDLLNPPKISALMPAIHDAVVTSITTLLPDVVASAGSVFSNGTAAALTLPAGLGHREVSVPVGAFLGSDGRRFYPLNRSGTTTSYFPAELERTLFFTEVNPQMFRAGTVLRLDFTATLSLLRANTRGRYQLVIEHGVPTSQITPATPATNFEGITWNAAPMLKVEVRLHAGPVPHRMGVEIIRSSLGVLSANKLIYGFATAADSIPASAACALRGRLIEWDTENAVAAPLGNVLIGMPVSQLRITTT